jgi:hypothetical protein
MVEISLSGSGEGLGGENPRGYSTTWFRNHSPGSERLDWSQLGDGRGHFTPDSPSRRESRKNFPASEREIHGSRQPAKTPASSRLCKRGHGDKSQTRRISCTPTGGLLLFRQTAPFPNPVLLVTSPLLAVDHLPVVRHANAVSAAWSGN